jgi:hypothetical protein
MSILIGYLDKDPAKRIHINDYSKLEHQHVYCAYEHQIVGRQGTKKAWHFAHLKGTDSECSRVMGDWHHWWQDRVYPDFLEIIMIREQPNAQSNSSKPSDPNTKNKPIKHIADMINGSNLVIEFQKSVVPGAIIQEREQFYQNMIWIFYCGEHQMNVVKQYGRYQRLRMTRGSKFFFEANKRSFLDFDKRGVLEVLKIAKATKAKPEIYVRIWTSREFDEEFMKGCLRPEADSRIHRPPYAFDESQKLTDKTDVESIRVEFESFEQFLKDDKKKKR